MWMATQLAASNTFLLSTNTMRPAVVNLRLPVVLCQASATKAVSFAIKNASYALDPCAEGVAFRSSTQLIPGLVSYGRRGADVPLKGRVFCSNSDYSTGPSSSDYYDITPQTSYGDSNLDARMRMKQYRREAIAQRQAAELEEEAQKYDLDPEKLLHKGDPDTIQAIVKEVIPMGYFVDCPDGKEGFLPSREVGSTGGIALLSKLFPVGSEITCRIVRVGGYGRWVVAMRKTTPVDLPDRPYRPPPNKYDKSESPRRSYRPPSSSTYRPPPQGRR